MTNTASPAVSGTVRGVVLRIFRRSDHRYLKVLTWTEGYRHSVYVDRRSDASTFTQEQADAILGKLRVGENNPFLDVETENAAITGAEGVPCSGLVGTEHPHPMLCFQHGGSEACEAENRKHGFTCPKCSNAGHEARREKGLT